MVLVIQEGFIIDVGILLSTNFTNFSKELFLSCLFGDKDEIINYVYQ